MGKLGVRPYPDRNENLSGYLLRLADCNGLIGIPELQAALGVEKKKVSGWGHWSGAQVAYLTDPLSAGLGRDCNADIKSTFKNSMRRWQFSEGRMFKELPVDFMRICPECLILTNVLNWRWSIGTVARCPVHRTPLLDSCPDCGSQFRWKSQIFRGCTSCSVKWSEIDNLTESGCQLSELEKSLVPDEDGNIEATLDTLDGLCVSLLKETRPYDSLYQVLQRMPYSRGHSDLILRVISGMREGARTARAPEPNFDLHMEVTFDPQPIKRELVEYVRPSRRKWVRDGDLSALRYQTDHRGLAEYLRVPKSDLLKVTEAEIMKSINSASVVRDQLFDVRDAVEVLSDRSTKCCDSGYRLLTAKDKALRRHLCTYGDVLCAVLEGEIQGYFENARDMSTVAVNENDFSLWLSSVFKRSCEEPVSLPAASAAIGCSVEKTRKLVQSGHLALARWQRYVDAIDGQSLYSLVLADHRVDD